MIKFMLFLCMLPLTNEFCEAKKVTGYIITENSDTLYGEIKVPNFNRITGGWIMSGTNLESFHFEVSFKNRQKNTFQTFKPEDILGFGFNYKSINYTFRRFVIVSKNFFKKERRIVRFLNLEYSGKVALYEDVIRVNNNNMKTNTTDITKGDSYVYYDYYLFNDSIGLKKVELTDDIKSLVDLLKLYGFEKDFLDSIPTKTNLKDIKMILMEYDTWCTKKPSAKE